MVTKRTVPLAYCPSPIVGFFFTLSATMASADFSRFVVTACPCGLALETSPVMDVFFPSYTRLIYSESSGQLWDFVLSCRLIRSHKPWYQVSVRRVRCLPTASFRFHLAMDTLAFGCSLPTVRAAWGLAPVRIRSCWANRKISHSNFF